MADDDAVVTTKGFKDSNAWRQVPCWRAHLMHKEQWDLQSELCVICLHKQVKVGVVERLVPPDSEMGEVLMGKERQQHSTMAST
jgi:hypothetical protein